MEKNIQKVHSDLNVDKKISEINGAKEFDGINFIELTAYDGRKISHCNK